MRAKPKADNILLRELSRDIMHHLVKHVRPHYEPSTKNIALEPTQWSVVQSFKSSIHFFSISWEVPSAILWLPHCDSSSWILQISEEAAYITKALWWFLVMESCSSFFSNFRSLFIAAIHKNYQIKMKLRICRILIWGKEKCLWIGEVWLSDKRSIYGQTYNG